MICGLCLYHWAWLLKIVMGAFSLYATLDFVDGYDVI